MHVNASSPSSAPRRRRHHAKGILGKRMCMHLLPGTNSTYVMMTRGCMHAPLSIKKVMSMQCVCMHPLAIIIKKYLSTPTKGIARYQSKREETGHLVHCTSPMWVLERDIVYRSVQEGARSYTIVSIAPLCGQSKRYDMHLVMHYFSSLRTTLSLPTVRLRYVLSLVALELVYRE